MRVALCGMAAILMLAVASGAPSAQTSTEKAPGTVVNPIIPRLNDVAGVGDPTLVNGLRMGGYVIFFRHAATDWSQHDTDYSNFDNRDGQRNLSDAGKADAGTIGKAFQALGIPIDSIFVSPMWRCRDTAQLAFGRYEIRMALFGKVPVAADGSTKPAEDRAQYRSERIHMLSTAPLKGMNRVLVGQQDPMLPVISGLHRDELREGDALVIWPMGGDKFKVVAQVTVADWTRLAAAYAGKETAK